MNALWTTLALILLAVLLLVAATRMWALVQPRRTVIFDYQRGVLYRDGKFDRVLDPGAYWTNMFSHIAVVDIRRQLHQIPGQEILTLDGIAVKLSAVLEYTIAQPERLQASTNNFVAAAYSHAQTSLRAAVTELTLEALLAARESVASRMAELLKPQLAELGVELNSARVLDIMLPSDIRRAFAQALAAQKEGLAALERARGETASLRSLANAARLMQDHPGLLQLRAMQAIEVSKGNTTLELKLDDPRPEQTGK